MEPLAKRFKEMLNQIEIDEQGSLRLMGVPSIVTLAGITHAVSGVQVRAQEIQCAVTGAAYCEMVVAPF